MIKVYIKKLKKSPPQAGQINPVRKDFLNGVNTKNLNALALKILKTEGRCEPSLAPFKSRGISRLGNLSHKCGKDSPVHKCGKDFPVLISVTLVDNSYIQKLNAKYRNKNTPTDVLAFPIPIPSSLIPPIFLWERSPDLDNRHQEMPPTLLPPSSTHQLINSSTLFLGDIYISVEQAEIQMQKGETLQTEVRRLLIHGILHLLGYKHGKKMKAQEDYYLI